jgi:flagellar capping protein FliD
VNSINNVDAVTNVRARIVQNGSTFKIAITHNDTGQAITLGGTGAILTGLHIASTGATDTTLSASVKVDGLPTTYASNTITTLFGTSSSAVPLSTINLKGASIGTVLTLEIKPDSTKIVADIKGFIEAYNDFVDFYDEQHQKGDGETTYAETSYLAKNSTLDLLQASLQNLVSGRSTGILASSQQINTLADLGIKLENNEDNKGTNYLAKLTINEDRFNTLIEADLDAVKAVLAFNAETTNSSFLALGHQTGLSVPTAATDSDITTIGGQPIQVSVSRTGSNYTVTLTNTRTRASDSAVIVTTSTAIFSSVVAGTASTGSFSTTQTNNGVAVSNANYPDSSSGTFDLTPNGTFTFKTPAFDDNGDATTLFSGLHLGYALALSDGSSSSTTVTFSEGIANQIYSYLTPVLDPSPDIGTLANEKRSINFESDDLKLKIEDLKINFENQKDIIRRKYAKLQEIMKQMESVKNHLAAYMGSMNKKD